jgi:hypothetical protein
MKLIIVILLLIALYFIFSKKDAKEPPERGGRVLPNSKPVYIDPPSVYFNEPITYSEWPQEITSSL